MFFRSTCRHFFIIFDILETLKQKSTEPKRYLLANDSPAFLPSQYCSIATIGEENELCRSSQYFIFVKSCLKLFDSLALLAVLILCF